MSIASLPRLSRRGDVQLLAGVTAVELLLLGAYLAVSPEQAALRYTLYPFVWINVGLWAGLTVGVPDASGRHKLFGAAIAGVYFFVLLYLAGLVGFSPDSGLVETVDVIEVESGSPGVERLHLVTESFYFSFITYRTLGYLVLSYLVYVTILDVSGNLLAGAIGLFSCVGCAFPVIASLSAGLFGTGAVASTVASSQSGLSTAVFVLAVLLLYWRPGFETAWLNRKS